ncbi:MAG TPA: radical SAM protein [Desulfuromonadaceae bacterium]
MRITLVAIHPYPSPQAVPLANAFLKAVAADVPAEIRLRDFFVGQRTADCVEELVAEQPAAVGFSLYVWNRALCREIAAELARRLPGVILFAGGPEATADPRGVLAEAVFAFLVVGEGEIAFAQVCARLASGQGVADLPGVTVMTQNGPSPASPRAFADLDAIPSPWLSGILDPRHYRGILWQLSRGCGFGCEFCYDSRDRQGVRHFSLDRIEAELRHFVDRGVSQVFVLDSTFNQDRRRAKTILRLIERTAPHIHFHFEVRSEFLDPEMARLFARVTCSLQIGLQSADTAVLKGVGRVFDRAAFAARVALLNESGAVFGFDLMYGLPGDTLHGFRDSLDFALGLYPNHLDIFPLAVLPGTPLAARSAALGLCHLPGPPYTVISSPTLGPEEMALARRLASACDIFYTRGKAVAWFNGVTDALGLKPSGLLERFGAWLEEERGAGVGEADLEDDEIWRLQRAFLTMLFGGTRARRLLPLVLDLADYHYHYAAAVQAPPPHLPSAGELRRLRPLALPWRLAPSARLAAFHYEILDILESGAPDLRELAGHLSPSGSWAVIYPGRGEVCTESLAEPYFRLLEQLDGRTPAGEIASRQGLPAAEARSFLEFAAAEGIILPPGC